MPKYRYKFCNGDENTVDVSCEHHALLTAMDKQERQNDRCQGRRTIPLDCCVNVAAKTDGADEGESE
jgi:hypothetical protein